MQWLGNLYREERWWVRDKVREMKYRIIDGWLPLLKNVKRMFDWKFWGIILKKGKTNIRRHCGEDFFLWETLNKQGLKYQEN